MRADKKASKKGLAAVLALIIAAAAAITVFGYLGDKDEKVNTVKAIPHNLCASDTQSIFSSECINSTQPC